MLDYCRRGERRHTHWASGRQGWRMKQNKGGGWLEGSGSGSGSGSRAGPAASGPEREGRRLRRVTCSGGFVTIR